MSTIEAFRATFPDAPGYLDFASFGPLSKTVREEILADLDAVASLDHDRILRNQLGLIDATLRTNAYVPGRDVIAGRKGNDRIYGGSGGDRLTGDRGRDVIKGGPGNDRIWGGMNRDRVNAGPGNDVVNLVDSKRDRVRCGSGFDTVHLDRHDDVLGSSCERVTR